MIKAIDFFCGAGGLTRGLINAGIEVISGIDIDPDCRETYERNNPPARFLCEDVRKLGIHRLKKVVAHIKKEDLLLAACAPCQPFSKHKKKPESDDLSSLLLQFARFVRALEPGQILIENVPGITRVKGYSTYRRFRRILECLNYSIAEGVVDAKEYGTPQTRRRFIILALRKQHASFPDPTHGKDRIPFATVRQAISRFPAIRAGETHGKVPNHSASSLSKLNLKRIRNCPPDGGDRRNWRKGLILKCHRNGHSGHTDVYGRMWWNRAAPALTCKCVSFSNGRYGHPEQDRAISLREAAALHGFSDDYVFYGASRGHLAQQIGNSVPVALSNAFGNHIITLHGKSE